MGNGKYDRHKAYTILDIVRDRDPVDLIMVRTNHPSGGDTILGYYRWDDGVFYSLDRYGHDCHVSESVVKHEWTDTGPVDLIVWVHSVWISRGDVQE